MDIRSTSLALLLACMTPCSALASGPATTGALPTPANKIVGLWTTEGRVTPCDNPAGPAINPRNTLLFHAGGTLIENSGMSPNRTWGMGTWSYDPRSRRYTMFLRFNRYLNGVYSGFSTVDRELVLNRDHDIATGAVVSTVYDTAGEQIAQYCGSAMSTRL